MSLDTMFLNTLPFGYLFPVTIETGSIAYPDQGVWIYPIGPEQLKNCNNAVFKDTILKILAILPIFAQVIGTCRFFIALKRYNSSSDFPDIRSGQVKHMVRGTLEFLNLGLILAIADAILYLRMRNERLGS